MRILITGGAGCLGSNLIEEWLPKGHTILTIDNLLLADRKCFRRYPIKVVCGTIADKVLIDAIFEEFEPDHVVHCAAAYKDPLPGEDTETNVLGTINVVDGRSSQGSDL